MRLESEVAIVTGSELRGSARPPRHFLEEGAKVIVADIGEEQGQATADALDELGEIAFVRTDIADETSVAECVAATVDRSERST